MAHMTSAVGTVGVRLPSTSREDVKVARTRSAQVCFNELSLSPLYPKVAQNGHKAAHNLGQWLSK